MDTPEPIPDDDAPPPEYPPPPRSSGQGRGYTIAAFVLALGALVIVPIIFGPAGVALGIVGQRKGDPMGRTAAIVAGIAMVIGIALGIALRASDDDALGLLLR